MDERCVTERSGARAGLVFGPLPVNISDGHLKASGVGPLSLLTFFAAAKKVSAAPHRGNANRPLRTQGKANAVRQATQSAAQAKAKKRITTYDAHTNHALTTTAARPSSFRHATQ
jgi:general secretion pathway protein K